MTKCLTPNCHYPAAPALKRGLCMRCHGIANKMVKESSMTWDEFVGLGLALELSETDSDPFTAVLNKIMENK